ncbi:MAG: hypothetical protein Q607_CBUC00216G0118 [Clostridium butyricum DORA_1]|nr:MAG: hypothetical protein Q607_CBUC00216G0118 [Clostridium butyricum DORA_1]
MEAKCDTPLANTEELYGNATLSLRILRNVTHLIFYEGKLKQAFVKAFNSILKIRMKFYKDMKL